MKLFSGASLAVFVFFLAAAFAVAYTGTSSSYQMELAVVDGSTPLTATSASYQLDVASGTLGQGPNSGVLFMNPGLGFERSTVAHPAFISGTAPSSNACCGTYSFASHWTDLAGRGVYLVIFQRSNGPNLTATLSTGNRNDGRWVTSFDAFDTGTVTYRWYALTYDGLWNASPQSSITIIPASSLSGSPAPTAAPTAAPSAAATAQPSSQSAPPIVSREVPTVAPPEVKNFGSGRSGESSASLSVNPSSGISTVSLSFVPRHSGQQLVTWEIPGLTREDVENGLVTFSPPEPIEIRYGSVIATWDVALRAGEEFKVNVEVAKVLPKSVIEELKPPVVKPQGSTVPAVPRPSTGAVASEAPVESPTPASSADNTALFLAGALVVLGALYFAFGRKKHKTKGL